MKKIILFLVITVVIILAGCEEETLDYSHFDEYKIESFEELEDYSSNRYIIYFYSESCLICKSVKNDVLSFFDDFSELEFLFVDIGNVDGIIPFEDFSGTPSIFVMSGNDLYELYDSEAEIRNFIELYSDIEYDYDLFEDQHITTYESALDINKDSYILYYYLDNCPHCEAAKPDFLPWAFTKAVEDIYFMNGAEVENPDTIPTELIILNSGTPLLILMSNGQFADEYYSGTEDVLGYIESIGNGEIIAEYKEPLTVNDDENDDTTVDEEEVLTYSDFSEKSLTSYAETLLMEEELYLMYYYNPYCSACNSIKEDMLLFLDGLDIVPFYLLDTNIATGSNTEVELYGVPSLYIISGNTIAMRYVGTTEITSFITDYSNGDIDLSIYN